MASKNLLLAVLASAGLSAAGAAPPSGSNSATASPSNQGDTTLMTVTVTAEPKTITVEPTTMTAAPTTYSNTTTPSLLVVPAQTIPAQTFTAFPTPTINWGDQGYPWLPNRNNTFLKDLKPGFDCFPAGMQPNGLTPSAAVKTECNVSTDVAKGECWCYPTPPLKTDYTSQKMKCTFTPARNAAGIEFKVQGLNWNHTALVLDTVGSCGGYKKGDGYKEDETRWHYAPYDPAVKVPWDWVVTGRFKISESDQMDCVAKEICHNWDGEEDCSCNYKGSSLEIGK